MLPRGDARLNCCLLVVKSQQRVADAAHTGGHGRPWFAIVVVMQYLQGLLEALQSLGEQAWGERRREGRSAPCDGATGEGQAALTLVLLSLALQHQPCCNLRVLYGPARGTQRWRG